jgi:hypothetical protein
VCCRGDGGGRTSKVETEDFSLVVVITSMTVTQIVVAVLILAFRISMFFQRVDFLGPNDLEKRFFFVKSHGTRITEVHDW